MIDPAHSLPLPKQAAAPGISRSSIYCLPQPVSERDQALMNRVDRLHLDYPFAGARMRRDMLNQAGVNAGRKHVGRLMRKMGVEALYRKPKPQNGIRSIRFIRIYSGGCRLPGLIRYGRWILCISRWPGGSSI